MIARNLLAFACVALFAAAPALAAKQIVVRSSGPSAKAYPVGKQLDSGSRVRLQPGDSLTVMGPSKARILQGPGNFQLAVAEQADPYSRSRFSARRGPPVPRGPWAIDVEQSGDVCAGSKHPLSLWRSANELDGKVTITGPAGRSVTLDWPAGTQTLSWPSALPLEQGAAYRVHLASKTAASEWKIVAVGPWEMDRAATAEALLTNGCAAQLDQLIERALWDN